MRFDIRKQGYISSINVTPFVDVMLVLLVIFMITAPFLIRGMKVDLPHTKSVKTLPLKEKKLIITIKKDKTIYVNRYKVDLKELKQFLGKLRKDYKNELYLKADKSVPYGFVVKVMGEIKEAGFKKLGVIAEPEEEKS